MRAEDREPPPVLEAGDGLALGPLRATVARLLRHPRLVVRRFAGRPDEIWAGPLAAWRSMTAPRLLLSPGSGDNPRPRYFFCWPGGVFSCPGGVLSLGFLGFFGFLRSSSSSSSSVTKPADSIMKVRRLKLTRTMGPS